MQIFLFIIIGLIGLSILVFIHELGHFVAARASGVEVEAFAIGWGPTLIRWKPHTTEYRLALLPLGGYCKMKGDQFLILAALDPSVEHKPEPGSFFAAPPIKRIFIALMGPLFNFFAAVVFLFLLAFFGTPESSPSARVIPLSALDSSVTGPADQAGMKPGDEIISINGHGVRNFKDLMQYISDSQGRPLDMVVSRPDGNQELQVVPQWNQKEQRFMIGLYPWVDPVIKKILPASSAELAGLQPGDRITALNGKPTPHTQSIQKILSDRSPSYLVDLIRDGKATQIRIIPDLVNEQVSLGIEYALPHYPAAPQPFGVSVSLAFNKAIHFLSDMIKGLVQLVTGKLNVQDSLSGPIKISYYIGETANQSFLSSWGEGIGAVANFLAFISLALFLMNLLPIPALDGGSVVIHLIELVRQKSIKPKTFLIYQQIGFFLILALIIFTTYNDITSLSKTN